MTKSKTLPATAAAIIIGGLLAMAGSTGDIAVGGVSLFVLAALIAFGINWLVYIPSFVAHTEHYFDLTGSLTYGGVTVLTLVLADRYDARSVLVTILVLIWAGRLGSFLFRRVKKAGSDGRFDKMKYDWAWFLMTWTIQGLWVFLTLNCVIAIISTESPEDLDVLAVVGLAVWAIGFAIEVVADSQKSAFKADPANDGRYIDVGLWAWSRHPNYFGEITLWVGMAIIALPVLSGWQFFALISPVFVYVLLMYISGVPLLEARGRKKWRDDPGYAAYVERTPVLVPRPPRSAGS